MNRWYWVKNKAVKDVRFLVSAKSGFLARDRVSFPDQDSEAELACMNSINNVLGTHCRDNRTQQGLASGDLIFYRDGKTIVLKQPR